MRRCYPDHSRCCRFHYCTVWVRVRFHVWAEVAQGSSGHGPWRSPPWRAVPAARTPFVRLLRPRRRERARRSASFFRGYSRATVSAPTPLVSGLDLGGIPARQVKRDTIYTRRPRTAVYYSSFLGQVSFPCLGGLATLGLTAQAGRRVCARRATRAQTAFSTLMNLRFVTICVEVEVRCDYLGLESAGRNPKFGRQQGAHSA